MKSWFGLLVLIMIVANVLAIYYLDPITDRWFRLLATVVFFLIFLFKYNTDKRLLIAFFSLTLCDGLLIFYEDSIVRYIIYVVRISAYLAIINFLYPYLSRLRLNFITFIITTFIIALDIYMLHDMAIYIPGYRVDTLFTILFYTMGLVSLALVATCISYLNRYADAKGFLLVIISICLVLSDLTFYNAYYLDFDVFYYADRIVNIIGIALLVVFAKKWIQNKEDESVTEI
ncbi:hypothetical protein [uncultured Christiangramia sp.]|uniref:hypothetical protein n=1 Tax=uncultured Christiangramia sp. TaxID=503836 RepID=UPI00261B0D76|nr:hypothetical protein [uncultured Christiangramia sp.]